MSTKLILSSSAILLGVCGVLLTFAPNEAASFADWPKSIAFLIQIVGAQYFGFAMINWMSKGNLIGGIYNRPLAVGNLTHFVVAALALIKYPIRLLSSIAQPWFIHFTPLPSDSFFLPIP